MTTSNAVLRLGALGLACFVAFSLPADGQRLPAKRSKILFPPVSRGIHIPGPERSASGTGEKDGDRSLQGVPTQLYSHGDPTNDEQYMLEMVNRARANPTAEGERLASVTDPDISSAYTAFGISREKLRTDFKTYPVRPPLAFNKHLIDAARAHSRDMDQNNFQGHTGSNGSSVGDRFLAAGYGDGVYSGENAAAYSKNVLYGHVGLNVDWGEQNQIELGHRANIMNFREFEYTEIGIGIIRNGRQFPNTGPYVITQDFGRHSSPFVLGVVYRDQNGNNFYDPGEGLPGVTVMPSSGEYYAVTSASGGYAIPTPKSGAMSLTASGGGLGGKITLNVFFNGDNQKIDFLPGMASYPVQTALNLPADGAVIATDSADLSWQGEAGVTTYHVQVSKSSSFNSDMIVDDSTVTGTSLRIRGLENEEYYYWRVRSKNSLGWGVFSQRRLIEVAMPPAAIVLMSPADGSQVAPTGNVEFQWTPSPTEVERYWFELGTDPQMNTTQVVDSTLTDTWYTMQQLEKGRTYYWRVKASNSKGWGPFSPIWSVSTPSSSVHGDRVNSTFRLSANQPNPFPGITTISFELARPANVTLTVLNSFGQEVATLVSGRLGDGPHEIRWDASGMPSGIYYYQLRAGEERESRAMILQR